MLDMPDSGGCRSVRSILIFDGDASQALDLAELGRNGDDQIVQNWHRSRSKRKKRKTPRMQLRRHPKEGELRRTQNRYFPQIKLRLSDNSHMFPIVTSASSSRISPGRTGCVQKTPMSSCIPSPGVAFACHAHSCASSDRRPRLSNQVSHLRQSVVKRGQGVPPQHLRRARVPPDRRFVHLTREEAGRRIGTVEKLKDLVPARDSLSSSSAA